VTVEAVERPNAAPAGGARILSGIPLSERIRASIAEELAELRQRHPDLPGVSVLHVGDDAASGVYAARILRNAEHVGLPGRVVRLPADSSTAAVVRALEEQNADPAVAGVIVQMPLPPQVELRAVIAAIDPRKDIDGIHPQDAGLLSLGYQAFYPSCAEAAVRILREYGIQPEAMHAVVIGRSNVVGKPAQLLLLREHATVTVCHRRTRDLPGEVRRADLVVVAAGSPGLVRGDMLQPGAIVVDCGINVVDGRIVGDVDAESVLPVAAALTPVPGGVGPLTNAVLLEHLSRAVRDHVERRLGARDRGDSLADAPTRAS
jgi:methylenetetrahydrofolate dehydrogenase (NADP+)/methenyltetrahydrofolate cyclohydrolase